MGKNIFENTIRNISSSGLLYDYLRKKKKCRLQFDLINKKKTPTNRLVRDIFLLTYGKMIDVSVVLNRFTDL